MWGFACCHVGENNTPSDKNVHRRRTKDSTMTITDRGITALLKKFSKLEMSDARGMTRARLLSRFVNDLATKQFGAVVFGYEMALQDSRAGHTMPLRQISIELERLQDNGIIIGIASSRNYQTVKTELRHMILPQYWKATHVGCCNGAYVGTLDDDFQSGQINANNESLALFLEFVASNGIISKNDIMADRRQVSIKKDHDNSYSVSKILHDVQSTDKTILNDIKIFDSGRFIDAVTYHTSKYNVVNSISSAIPKDRHILCIGYDGQWPGSDCELLTHRYSLSTGTVSATAASCWNLLPDSMRGEQGTLAYLRGVKIGERSGFNIFM